ncbi:unnamed protein product, partial [Staurois parvus]
SLRHSRSPINGKSRRRQLSHVISCVQSQLITDHQGTDDQCALMISVAPVPPVSVHQCQLSVPISAYQCTSMPHQCTSELPFSVTYHARQCHLTVPVSAT